jgi:hypothetical protein
VWDSLPGCALPIGQICSHARAEPLSLGRRVHAVVHKMHIRDSDVTRTFACKPNDRVGAGKMFLAGPTDIVNHIRCEAFTRGSLWKRDVARAHPT